MEAPDPVAVSRPLPRSQPAGLCLARMSMSHLSLEDPVANYLAEHPHLQVVSASEMPLAVGRVAESRTRLHTWRVGPVFAISAGAKDPSGRRTARLSVSCRRITWSGGAFVAEPQLGREALPRGRSRPRARLSLRYERNEIKRHAFAGKMAFRVLLRMTIVAP